MPHPDNYFPSGAPDGYQTRAERDHEDALSYVHQQVGPEVEQIGDEFDALYSAACDEWVIPRTWTAEDTSRVVHMIQQSRAALAAMRNGYAPPWRTQL